MTNNQTVTPETSSVPLATGIIALADGTVIRGLGFGAVGDAVGEVCFNTAMTGYQEILTDPSYAGQIITFTFPHIGNVGVNNEDIEATTPVARGLIIREEITRPSNYRSHAHLDAWLKSHNLIGLCGVDTRKLTRLIRLAGAPNAVIAHSPTGDFDLPALISRARAWPGLEGMDLAREVSCTQSYQWTETLWQWNGGYGNQSHPKAHVVLVDYGVKRNILRGLASSGARLTVVPATSTTEDILRLKPDGILLSNGPGDPAATGDYAIPVIRDLINSGLPIFGICLGHQLLGLAMGARTLKMHQGHRGANHPVKDLGTGKVEITTMNHGFTVDEKTLPSGARASHISLFDGSLCGIEVEGKPIISVQHHPEASPGPQDSHYLFTRFMSLIEKHKKAEHAKA